MRDQDHRSLRTADKSASRQQRRHTSFFKITARKQHTFFSKGEDVPRSHTQISRKCGSCLPEPASQLGKRSEILVDSQPSLPQTSNKHKIRCSMSSITRKIESKTTMRYNFLLTRVVKTLEIYQYQVSLKNGEGNGNPLQYSCLENPMEGGAWQATVHGVAKSRTRLSDFTSLIAEEVKYQGLSYSDNGVLNLYNFKKINRVFLRVVLGLRRIEQKMSRNFSPTLMGGENYKHLTSIWYICYE